MRHTALLCAVIIFIMTKAFAFRTPDQITLYSAMDYGTATGFLQIPRGGSSTTSTPKRPTLAELGIDHFNDHFFQAGFKAIWQPFAVYLEYQYNHPAGDGILTNDLLTHGIIFPAATPVHTKAHFDLYQLGLQRRFCLWRNFILYPEAEIAILGFGYRINSPYQETSRSFGQITERLGIGGDIFVNRYLFLTVNAASSIPYLADLQLRTVKADINFTVLHTRCLKTMVFTGIGYLNIDYEDEQTFPNHLKVSAPYVYAGVQLGC